MTAVARTVVLGRRRTATAAEQFRDPVVLARCGGFAAVLYVNAMAGLSVVTLAIGCVVSAATVAVTTELVPRKTLIERLVDRHVERRGARS